MHTLNDDLFFHTSNLYVDLYLSVEIILKIHMLAVFKHSGVHPMALDSFAERLHLGLGFVLEFN